MNSKKIMIVILGLGALIIIVLLGVNYALSYSFKSKLQNAINDNFKKTTEHYNQNAQEIDFPINLAYEPFVCEGIKSYRCLSKHISVINTKTNKTLVGLNNFSFNIEDISANSIRISIDLPSLSLEIFDEIQKNEVFEALKPVALTCKQDSKILNKKTGEITSDVECKITAQNVEYHYNTIGRTQSKKFIDQKILYSLLYYYSNFGLFDEKNDATKDFNFAIDKISFKFIESKSIKNVLYSLLKKNYDTANGNVYPIPIKPKYQFNDKTYENMLEKLQNVTDLVLIFFEIDKSPFLEGFSNFFQGLKLILLGEASEVNLTLLPKVSPAPYFEINKDMLKNIREESAQQELYTKLMNRVFDNYDLVSETIMNKTHETK